MFTTGEFNYVLKISFKPFRQLFIQHHRKSVKCNLTRHLLSLLGPIPFVLNPRTESGPPRKNLRKQKTSKITHCDWPALQFNFFFINHSQSRTHSRPQVPRSFWSAPRMATSDQTQFSKHAQIICFIFSANQIWQNCGEVRESRTSDVGPAQKSRFWPKKSVASGNENVSYPESSLVTRHASLVSWPLFKGNEDAVLRGCHIINE